MYRCVPKKHDPVWLVAVLGLPLAVFVLCWIAITFFSGEIQQSQERILLYSVFAIAVYALILFCIVHGVKAALWSSAKCAVTAEGIRIRYFTGKEKLVPWGKIQSACICCAYAEGNTYPVIRFSTDRMLDESRKAQGRTGAILNGWPRWLDQRFLFKHADKITVFEYSPEAEENVRKYYPDLKNCMDIR